MEDDDSRRHAAFWEAYRGCAEENRVPPDRSPYYVRWVKLFIEFLPGKRLKARYTLKPTSLWALWEETLYFVVNAVTPLASAKEMRGI